MAEYNADVFYRGMSDLGSALSGGGIEGMLQRERAKAELENQLAQLRLQAELKQRAEQAKWEHEAQQQAELEARAREIFGEGGGYAGLDNTSILQSALSGPGPVETAPMRSGSSMFTPNPRAMAFLAANDPKALASVMNSERGNALEYGLQENPFTSQKMDELASRSYQHLQSGDASAARASAIRQLLPFQVETAQSRANKGKREDDAAARLEETLGLTPEDLGALEKALSAKARQRKLEEPPPPRKETLEEKAQKGTEQRLISEYADLFGDKNKDPGGKRSQAILRELQRINPGLVQTLTQENPRMWGILPPTISETLQLAPRGSPQPMGESVAQPSGASVPSVPDLRSRLYPSRKKTEDEEP